jgi:hypothetical protein
MPFGYGVGDHRAFIVDIPIESLVGHSPVKIIRPAGRRLNSKMPGCSKAYNASLEKNITKHRLLERLHEAHTGNYSEAEQTRRVIIIDEEGKMYMRHAKKNMSQDKELSNTLLARGSNMDPQGTSVQVAPSIPQRKT